VLLSDGANNAGRAPLQAAAEARAAKVPIYTIAYGTDSGYVDLDGKREPVPVDHEEMKQIAAATNGEDFAAATADQLKKVYQNIGSDVGYEKADREVTARFAGYGLALAVLARWVPFLWEQNGRDGRSS
jgi:Ca-activated chloride channel family protein